jgi:hypothetical protein
VKDGGIRFALLLPFAFVEVVSAQGHDVYSLTRQLVLASALLAAWFILGGGNAARAGYVSTSSLNDPEGLSADPSSLAAALGERAGGMAGSSKPADSPYPNELDRESPERDSPLAKRFHTAWHFGSPSGAGDSTGSSSVNGPSSQSVGNVSRLEFPQIEIVGLLPPQKGVVHPFSVASFLFRPPRAP